MGANIQITIIRVYAGSVIIDYSLESNVVDLVSTAIESVDKMIGGNINITIGGESSGSSFVLELESNTPTNQVSVVVEVIVEYTVIEEDGCALNHSAIAVVAKEFTNDWRSISELDLEFTVTSLES